MKIPTNKRFVRRFIPASPEFCTVFFPTRDSRAQRAMCNKNNTSRWCLHQRCPSSVSQSRKSSACEKNRVRKRKQCEKQLLHKSTASESVCVIGIFQCSRFVAKIHVATNTTNRSMVLFLYPNVHQQPQHIRAEKFHTKIWFLI